MPVSDDDLAAAADAVGGGGLVVYPTETVYGVGADALDADAVEAVFDAKRRDRDKPLSFAFPDVDSAVEHLRVGDTERAFMDEFLPGPVTVVCEKRDTVPDVLTGGRDRVGVRVPDHDVALALLDRVAPLTATSANVSGRPSVTDPGDLGDDFLDAVDYVLDAGETAGGTPSTVVDVARNDVLREGAIADAVKDWLSEHA
ncbi:MAG: L-threonylcarbamoyladenylate synthase [Halobacterium sp.]